MTEVSIILRRPPYGSVDAAEAVRHALGGATQDVTVNLLLLAGGVNAARKGQTIRGTEYASIEDAVRDCMDMGVNVACDRGSLGEESLSEDGIIDGVSILDGPEIAAVISRSGTTMVF